MNAARSRLFTLQSVATATHHMLRCSPDSSQVFEVFHRRAPAFIVIAFRQYRGADLWRVVEYTCAGMLFTFDTIGCVVPSACFDHFRTGHLALTKSFVIFCAQKQSLIASMLPGISVLVSA